MGEAADVVRHLVEVEDDGELEFLKAAAGELGAEVEEVDVRDMGVTTAAFLIGLTTVVAGALQRYFDRRADRRLGGQIIDLRPGQTLVRRDLGLRPELLVVVLDDGRLEVRALDDGSGLRELYTSVIGALLAAEPHTVEEAAKAVTAAVGTRATVTPAERRP